MSDVLLFFIGCLVTLMVAAAVGLLLWGAANEPRGTLFPSKEADDATPQADGHVAPRARRSSERVAG